MIDEYIEITALTEAEDKAIVFDDDEAQPDLGCGTSKQKTIFHCTACSRYFKTEKGCTNHEKSKKHKDNVRTIENLLVGEVARGNSQQDVGDFVTEQDSIALRKNKDSNFLTVESCSVNGDLASSDDESGHHPLTRNNSLNLLSHVVKRNIIERIPRNGEETSAGVTGKEAPSTACKIKTVDSIQLVITDADQE